MLYVIFMHLGTVIGSQVKRLCPLRRGRKLHINKNVNISIFFKFLISPHDLDQSIAPFIIGRFPSEDKIIQFLISLFYHFEGSCFPENEFWVSCCENNPEGVISNICHKIKCKSNVTLGN
jgi:hypothetical protein